jgi:hypothetical protein
MPDPEVIDRKAVRILAEARAIRSATIFGQPGGWSIRIRYGEVERAIAVQRASAPRVWRTLLAAVVYVRDELGVLRFEVDMTGHNAGAKPRRRPDQAAALRRAHEAAEHDRWFRAEVEKAAAEAEASDPDWQSDEEVMADARRHYEAHEAWRSKTKH